MPNAFDLAALPCARSDLPKCICTPTLAYDPSGRGQDHGIDSTGAHHEKVRPEGLPALAAPSTTGVSSGGATSPVKSPTNGGASPVTRGFFAAVATRVRERAEKTPSMLRAQVGEARRREETASKADAQSGGAWHGPTESKDAGVVRESQGSGSKRSRQLQQRCVFDGMVVDGGTLRRVFVVVFSGSLFLFFFPFGVFF